MACERTDMRPGMYQAKVDRCQTAQLSSAMHYGGICPYIWWDIPYHCLYTGFNVQLTSGLVITHGSACANAFQKQ